MIRGLDPVHAKTIKLSPGQVFQGTITQLYPGQLAQLKMGNMTLTARLEAQLEKGQQYWFRVMAGEGIPKIKVMENVPPAQVSGNQGVTNAQTILQQMGISSLGAHERLLSQLNQSGLPFTKANLTDGARLLQQSTLPSQSSLDLITSMIQRNMPLTQATFQSLASLQSNESMSETMSKLLIQLRGANQQTQPVQQLLSQMLNQSDPLRQGTALQTLLQQMNSTQPQMQEQALQTARQIGIIPQNTNDQQVFEQFKTSILRPENQEMIRQIWPQLFQNSSGSHLQEMNPRGLFSMLINNVKWDQPLVAQQLTQLINSQASPNQVTTQLDQWLSTQPTDSSRALWTLVNEARSDSSFLLGGSKEDSPLRMFMQQLGMQYESDIRSGSGAQDSAQRAASLKSALLLLLQHPQGLTQGVREQAEFLLQRITGFQLVSSEQHGPVQHTLFQVPIKVTDKYQDMTIQWEGRQTKDGSIDEEHCRILFYLTLEALEDTVVDVQIQNRVMTLTIYNENERPAGVQEMWMPILTENLQKLDYRLSAIKWKQPSAQTESSSPKFDLGRGYQKDDYGYRGVDVRI